MWRAVNGDAKSSSAAVRASFTPHQMTACVADSDLYLVSKRNQMFCGAAYLRRTLEQLRSEINKKMTYRIRWIIING